MSRWRDVKAVYNDEGKHSQNLPYAPISMPDVRPRNFPDACCYKLELADRNVLHVANRQLSTIRHVNSTKPRFVVKPFFKKSLFDPVANCVDKTLGLNVAPTNATGAYINLNENLTASNDTLSRLRKYMRYHESFGLYFVGVLMAYIDELYALNQNALHLRKRAQQGVLQHPESVKTFARLLMLDAIVGNNDERDKRHCYFDQQGTWIAFDNANAFEPNPLFVLAAHGGKRCVKSLVGNTQGREYICKAHQELRFILRMLNLKNTGEKLSYCLCKDVVVQTAQMASVNSPTQNIYACLEQVLWSKIASQFISFSMTRKYVMFDNNGNCTVALSELLYNRLLAQAEKLVHAIDKHPNMAC